MRLRLTLGLMLGLAFILASFLTAPATAQERSLEEFKKYVEQRLPGQLNDQQKDQLAKIVDQNGDGKISEEEFATRMDALEKVMSGAGESGDSSSDSQEKAEASDEDDSDDRASRWERMNRRMQARLTEAGIEPGKPLPDVTGLDINGDPFPLSKLKDHYSVIVSGCLT